VRAALFRRFRSIPASAPYLSRNFESAYDAATILVPQYVLAEMTLSFLGLGGRSPWELGKPAGQSATIQL